MCPHSRIYIKRFSLDLLPAQKYLQLSARSDLRLQTAGQACHTIKFDQIRIEDQMMSALSQILLLCLLLASSTVAEDRLRSYHASPRLLGPSKLMIHDSEDAMLNALDEALQKISTIYVQALLSGTHTPELDISLRSLELQLFELLDQLYRQHRLKDYMKYEAEVTRQMIIYNMLKRMFGYTQDKQRS